MRFFNISVADSAKTAEQIIAILQLVVIGAVVGAVFFLIMKVRDMRSDLISGLVVGALFGLPLVGITIAIEQSTVHPVVIILWLLVLFPGVGPGAGSVIRPQYTPRSLSLQPPPQRPPF